MTQTTSTPTSAPKRVYAAIRNGELRAIRLSRRMIRIRQSDFENWLSTLETTQSSAPAAQRRELLDPETIAFLSELAAAAPALSEEQKDTIRAAFRAPPKMPRPVPRPKRAGR